MEDNTNRDPETAPVEDASPIAQPAATSTPEQSPNTSDSSLRRSQRIRPERIPCDCCTTGMHVRCYTNITGRRPLHATRTPAVRRSLKAKRMPRINGTEAVERPTSARSRNNSGSATRATTRCVKRRRPLFDSPERRLVEGGEIAGTSGRSVENRHICIVEPLPPKRVCLPQNGESSQQLLATALDQNSSQLMQLRSSKPMTVGINENVVADNPVNTATVEAADEQEPQDSDHNAYALDLPLRNVGMPIPFIEIKQECESLPPDESNGSFLQPRSKEFYRQNQSQMAYSSSEDEEDLPAFRYGVLEQRRTRDSDEDSEDNVRDASNWRRCGVM